MRKVSFVFKSQPSKVAVLAGFGSPIFRPPGKERKRAPLGQKERTRWEGGTRMPSVSEGSGKKHGEEANHVMKKGRVDGACQKSISLSLKRRRNGGSAK